MDALANNGITGDYYIGLGRNDIQRGVFQWLDGQPVNSKFYQNWANGFPTDPDLNQNCVHFHTASSRGYTPGKWKTTDCLEQKNYICGIPTETQERFQHHLKLDYINY